MNKTRLVFCGVSDVVGSDSMAIILLTDVEHKNAISVVCDDAMRHQISIRCSAKSTLRNKFLPEVLMGLLSDSTDVSQYEIVIYDLVEGEYKTLIRNINTLVERRLRLSDAVLLSQISDIPLYMWTDLFDKQQSPYNSWANRLAIPINTLDMEKLEEQLQRAIKEEDYHLASQIKEEIRKRKLDTGYRE